MVFCADGAVEAVDHPVQLQRFGGGQVPPELVFLAEDEGELALEFVLPLPGREAEHGRLAAGRIEQAGEHLQHGRLARAVRAEEADELALVAR